MSVKNELDNFFEKFLAAYQKTEDGLPKRPRRRLKMRSRGYP